MNLRKAKEIATIYEHLQAIDAILEKGNDYHRLESIAILDAGDKVQIMKISSDNDLKHHAFHALLDALQKIKEGLIADLEVLMGE